MILRVALILAMISGSSTAAVRSGKAEADWLRTSSTFENGKPVQTGIRLVMDEGWHTYWHNPGEAGMELTAEWELPAGWTAGDVEYPAPVRFKAGGLVSYGYKGTVIFPVKFTPPAGFTGAARLRGKLSWLSCNDDQCLPGKADLEITLEPGTLTETPEAKLILEVLAKVPQPAENGLLLGVSEKPKGLTLRIESAAGKMLDLEDYECFPATPGAIDPAQAIQFTRTGAAWTAEAAKSEYFTQPLKELVLVLVGKSGQAPVLLRWSGN